MITTVCPTVPALSKKFPELCGEASTGKMKIWRIHCEQRENAGVIITEHGYVDGKMTRNEKTIYSGKNIGKKNETTPFQQACCEAASMWQKKKDSGYNNADSPEPPIVSFPISSAHPITDTIPLPMLALDYTKRGHNIEFPCFVQRKYDGTRCIASSSGLYSRNRKTYANLEHIREDIKKIICKFPGIILDGELYSNTLTFQEIVGLVRRETLTPNEIKKQTQIQFYCYDIIDIDSKLTFTQRLEKMMLILRHFRSLEHIRFVLTELCSSNEEMKKKHDQYVKEGFEGIMLRNKNGVYRPGVRSSDLQKYKEFRDGEYEVIGFTQGEGLESGCVIWNCRDSVTGAEFACRPRGTHELRRELYKRASEYIGKYLTVRYQELTDDGLPRFPVGISFRDYE